MSQKCLFWNFCVRSFNTTFYFLMLYIHRIPVVVRCFGQVVCSMCLSDMPVEQASLQHESSSQQAVIVCSSYVTINVVVESLASLILLWSVMYTRCVHCTCTPFVARNAAHFRLNFSWIVERSVGLAALCKALQGQQHIFYSKQSLAKQERVTIWTRFSGGCRPAIVELSILATIITSQE